MIYLYFPLFTWIAICTLNSLTGVRGDGSEVNSTLGKNTGVNFAYVTNNVNHAASKDSLERSRRALQEIYLIREKKENEDPMNYLNKLSSDMEDSSRSPFQNVLSGSMIEGIIDPPQIELQFHKKVPNCASEFNITKIIELVDDDKRQRICPCTCQLSKPDDKAADKTAESSAEMQAQQSADEANAAETGGAALPPAPSAAGAASTPAAPVATSIAPVSVAAVTVSANATTEEVAAVSSSSSPAATETNVEFSTQTPAAQTGQVAVVNKAEAPGPPKQGEPAGGAKTPKPDQSKAAISQKKVEDKQKVKTPAQKTAQPAARIGTPLSRVAVEGNKKGPMLQPRPPAAVAPAIRPANANMQIKNALKNPQQIANKPLHSKMPDIRGPLKGPVLPGHTPQKLLNAKQQIANPGWDLVEPGAAYPGLFQFRQP